MWGCSLSTKGRVNFQAKTVVPDQTLKEFRPGQATYPTHCPQQQQGNSSEWRTGDSDMGLHCPEGLTSEWELRFDTSSPELLSSQKINTVWQKSRGLPTALSTYPNCIKSCYLIPPSSLHPTESFLSFPHETLNVIFHKLKLLTAIEFLHFCFKIIFYKALWLH